MNAFYLEKIYRRYLAGTFLPWVPEAFHARFPVSSAEHVSASGRRNEAPRRTREKTSGT